MTTTRITDYLGSGVASARPASLAIASGALGLYFATDTGAMSLWDGAWVALGNMIPIAAGDVLANLGTVTAVPAAATLSAVLDKGLAASQGDIAFRSGTVWAALAPGTAGQVLTTQGTVADPTWTTPSSHIWNAGTVTAIGTGVTLTSGTLTAASGGGGTVTEIDTGAGLHGGPITGGGTISADWNGGTVSALGTGLVLNSGTIDASTAAKTRTLPFSLVGKPPNGQHFNLTLTQAGTLLANGGTPQAYVPTAPTATELLVLNTVHSGTVTARGTISVSTSAIVSWPTFSAVGLVAGDTVQLVNQATQDTTFADACLSLQFQVT
jgi:hypothetical protein